MRRLIKYAFIDHHTCLYLVSVHQTAPPLTSDSSRLIALLSVVRLNESQLRWRCDGCVQSRQVTWRTLNPITSATLTELWSSNAACVASCLLAFGIYVVTSNFTTASNLTRVRRVQKRSHVPSIYASTCTVTPAVGRSDHISADTVSRSLVSAVNSRNTSRRSIFLHRTQSTGPRRNTNTRYVHTTGTTDAHTPGTYILQVRTGTYTRYIPIPGTYILQVRRTYIHHYTRYVHTTGTYRYVRTQGTYLHQVRTY